MKFLRDCLEAGIRSGNLQPITTVNQCNDLIRRIDEAAAQCGQPSLTDAERATALAGAASHEQDHALKMRLEAKMRQEFMDSRTSADRHNNVPFDGHRAMAKIHAMNREEIIAAIGDEGAHVRIPVVTVNAEYNNGKTVAEIMSRPVKWEDESEPTNE
jgi:hypothetical protein